MTDTSELLGDLREYTQEEIESLHSDLLGIDTLEEYSAEEAINKIGTLIDCGNTFDSQESFEKALEWANEVESRDLSPESHAFLHYYWGTCFSELSKEIDEWFWQNEFLEKSIFHFRTALSPEGVEALPDKVLCRLYTNLANDLSQIGRFIESIQHWNSALEINPAFVMARGNKGLGIQSYGGYFQDDYFSTALSRFAYFELYAATLLESKRPDAVKLFENAIDIIKNRYDIIPPYEDLNEKNPDLGETVTEKKYHFWVLYNRLFINPINDLGEYTIAAADELTLPPSTNKIDDKHITSLEFISQLEQEYVSARYSFYEGLKSNGDHLSGKNTFIRSVSPFVKYSHGIEQMKSSIRTCYSIFDKISFFLNYYFNLDIKPHQTSFDSIWFQNRYEKENLRDVFQGRKNWPLRGLFWMSKDLIHGNEMYVKNSLEPGARELARLRDRLEHRYVQIYQNVTEDQISSTYGPYENEVSYKMSFQWLEKIGVQMLKKVRAAIIYFILAIRKEEQQRIGGVVIK